jgi:hypothetical protein
MKKQHVLSLLLALILMSCGNSRQKIKYEKDSVKLKQDFLPGVSGFSPKALLEDSLYGIWTDGSDENATIKIKPDSIYYPDQLRSYKYALKGDSIKIYYNEYTYRARIYFVKDTLMMDSKEDESVKFWKFKN